jgi:Phytanoyl-CoA dioxygenase (PhyH)
MRVKELQKRDSKKLKAAPPKVLQDPVTGETVWVAPATKAALTLAQRKQRPPWLLSRRYLVTLSSPVHRHAVYDRAARALAELETRVLPHYGNRPWQCIVTLKEPTINHQSSSTATAGTARAGGAANTTKSPYFCWDKRGRLELASFPHLVDKMPRPPHFPGYRIASNNRNSSRGGGTRNRPGRGQSAAVKPSPVEQPDSSKADVLSDDAECKESASGVQEVKDDEEDEEEEDDDNEEEELSEELLDLRELQERQVSGLSKLAWEEKWRVPVPTVHYKWISPLRQSFSTRKSAWDNAVQLCKQEVLLDRVLTGFGAHGKRIKVAPQPRAAVMKAGKLRFERDGLWIVGQEEEWCRDLLGLTAPRDTPNTTSSSQTVPVESASDLGARLAAEAKQQRRLSGLAYFIKCRRKAHHQSRQQEFAKLLADPLSSVDIQPTSAIETEQRPSQATIVSPSCVTTTVHLESLGSSTTSKKVHARAIFSLKDAEKELRCLWKTLPEQERQRWTDEAHNAERRTNTESMATMDSAIDHDIDGVSAMIASTLDADQSPNAVSAAGSPLSNAVEDLEVSKCFPSSPFLRLDIEKVSVVSASPSPPVGLDDSRSAVASPERLPCQEDDKTVVVSPLAPPLAPMAPAEKSSIRVSHAAPSKMTTTTMANEFNRSIKWCLNDEQIRKCYDAGMEHYDQILRTVSARDLTLELQDGFDLLRERGKGRWDMSIPELDSADYWFLNDTKKAPWMPIVKEILGKDVVLIHKGMFLSMPGSSKQAYHQDGPHLTTQYQKPCHAINVFIPLVDLTLDNGPTEFCLGSHILGHEELDDSFLYTPTVVAGKPIIFDYRLGHRGLANTSTTCRPIVYCTYAAAADGKEFRDSVNFSRKRYHRIGDLVEKGLSREERAEKRMRSVEEQQLEEAIAASRASASSSKRRKSSAQDRKQGAGATSNLGSKVDEVVVAPVLAAIIGIAGCSQISCGSIDNLATVETMTQESERSKDDSEVCGNVEVAIAPGLENAGLSRVDGVETEISATIGTENTSALPVGNQLSVDACPGGGDLLSAC